MSRIPEQHQWTGWGKDFRRSCGGRNLAALPLVCHAERSRSISRGVASACAKRIRPCHRVVDGPLAACGTIALALNKRRDGPMDRTQFKEQLDLLFGEIVHAIVAYRVGKGILTNNQERLDAINALHVFFGSVAEASRRSVYLSLGKIFDSDKKTASIWSVLAYAEQSPSVLTPYLLPQSLADIRSALERHKPLINGIKRVRNRTIAHIEAESWRFSAEEAGSTFGEIEEALAIAEVAFEELNRGFDDEPTLYDAVKVDAVGQTESIIRLVMNYGTADSV